ncbi:MAG TPA: hypothetical protein PKJ56_05480, partial [Promineifilum sp.]|nr:hypothetical protein [Promineifilum sp.]
METALILAAIVVVALIFRGLRALLGDEWPPAAELEPPIRAASGTTPVEPARAPSPDASFPLKPGADTPAPSVVTAAVIVKPPLATPDTPSIAEPAAVERQTIPIEPLSVATTRSLAWALAGGGGALALLAQLVTPAMPPDDRARTFTLTLLGGLLL